MDKETIQQYSLQWYKEMRKLNKDTIISLVESNGKQRDSLKDAVRIEEHKNKTLQKNISDLQSEIEFLKKTLDKRCNENNEYSVTIHELESKLKDCTENEKHYVDKCFSLEEQLAEKEKELPKWIKVEDRLPLEGSHVLVYGKGNRRMTSLFKDNCFMCYDLRTEWLEEAEEITHWMPLPNQPQ
jgi:chromosome segregation ATPase